MPEDDRPELLVKLHERRLHHQQRGRLHRAAIVALGFFLIMIGIGMSGPGVPGPGIATILVGLTFLALEFDRAERLLERAIRWADVAKDRAEQSTPPSCSGTSRCCLSEWRPCSRHFGCSAEWPGAGPPAKA